MPKNVKKPGIALEFSTTAPNPPAAAVPAAPDTATVAIVRSDLLAAEQQAPGYDR